MNVIGASKHTLLKEGRRNLPFSFWAISKGNMLYSTAHKCISSVCSIPLPSDHGDLYRMFLEDGLDTSLVIGVAVDCILSGTNGSIEKRTLQGLLLSSLSIQELLD